MCYSCFGGLSLSFKKFMAIMIFIVINLVRKVFVAQQLIHYYDRAYLGDFILIKFSCFMNLYCLLKKRCFSFLSNYHNYSVIFKNFHQYDFFNAMTTSEI